MPALLSLFDAPAVTGAGDGALDELVCANLPLVGHCVGELLSRLPGHVDRDDLAGAGVEGLVQAARSWRPETGVPFTAFARTRVRGAIVDELRAADWASRGVRTRARRAAETTEQLTAALGRPPRTEELADALGVAPEQVHRVRAETHRSYLSSLEETRSGDDGVRAVHDSVADPGLTPEEHVVLADHVGRLRAAVELLPERVREAVRGHYLDEEPMAAIAARLGVTESRVSQLRSEGVALLRAAMAAADADHGDDAPAPGPAPQPVPTRREAAYTAAVTATASTRRSLDTGRAALGYAPTWTPASSPSTGRAAATG